jgi:hypothetical protein
MDRPALQRFLDSERIDADAYSLDGERRDELYVLDQRGTRWVVYYSERGLETEIMQFETEDSACRHLMDLLLRDSTTRLEQ